MLEKRIHKLLFHILEKSYNNANAFLPFYIEIIPKEMKAKNGDYSPSTKKIRIFNLSRETNHIIKTAIHELAHHCELVIHNKCTHSKDFYGIYKKLLEAAVTSGVIDIIEARGVRDITILERLVGKILVTKEEDNNEFSNLYLIKIKNSFFEKERLKAIGYRFNKHELVWTKEINSIEIEEEKDKLKEYIDINNISITKLLNAEINVLYYIVVSNCYDYRGILKNKKYQYKGYGYEKGHNWVKRIIASELKDETDFLQELKGITFKTHGKRGDSIDSKKSQLQIY